MRMLKVEFSLLNLKKYFWKLGSHHQGPGEQVDQGLGEVHHDPKCLIFWAYEHSGIVEEKLHGC